MTHVDYESMEPLIWECRPSLLRYFMTYLIAAIVIVIGYKIQYLITPYPFELVKYGNWGRPYSAWRLADWRQFVVAIIYIAMVYYVLKSIYCVIKAKLTFYSLNKEQIMVRSFTLLGFVNKHVEMYRIIDFMRYQTFPGAFFGLSNVLLHTSDRVTPVIKLHAVRRGRKFLEILRTETERCRHKKGVREFTTYTPVSGDVEN